jgi:hypothetical protein
MCTQRDLNRRCVHVRRESCRELHLLLYGAASEHKELAPIDARSALNGDFDEQRQCIHLRIRGVRRRLRREEVEAGLPSGCAIATHELFATKASVGPPLEV